MPASAPAAGRPAPPGTGNAAAPVLLAVAHGSRDPAAQQCVHALLSRVREIAPGVDVRAAFLENAEPLLPDALSRAAAGAGTARVAIVPLLLATGYHATEDIGRLAARAGVPVSGPLGPDPVLVPVLAQRLAEAGAPAGAPVVLAAAGSRDPRAAAGTGQQAALLADQLRVPVRAAYLSAARPTVAEAVAELAARTGQPVAVATFLLAPGLFHRQLRQMPAPWLTAPLGPHPAVARLIATRFQQATSAPLR